MSTAYFGIGIYVKGSVEAARLYCEAFGLTLGYHVLNGDGSYFHSELVKGGGPALSVVEAEAPAPHGNPIELGYTFDTREQLEKAFSLLKEGGTARLAPQELPWSPLAATVTDRFGVNWFLSLPQHRPPEGFGPASRENKA